jgi:hypothetical protein
LGFTLSSIIITTGEEGLLTTTSPLFSMSNEDEDNAMDGSVVGSDDEEDEG